ncbi:FAD binding domain-containing protein [Streptomyces sp. MMBL 11-3]|uniref:FAD binding domain-containing protein n=1 Tax=Streptomyces sp. MMBL 11-3 TaxID=3382639 RepID=UPI0039B4435D
MIPPAFAYARPSSVEEAVRLLAGAGEDAKVLAGGQSLLPLLRLRLAFPELVVDVGRIPGLRGVREEGGTLVIGALTTHHAVVADPLVRRHAGLLAAATATVADPAVRHRGTLGGSLAHADPAGDLPAVALALDAELVAVGPDGRRTVPAREFFVDYLQTALRPDELLVEVRVPKTDEADGWGFHYEKFSRVAQAWAMVGVAALVRRDDGHIAQARIGLTNMGTTPLRATATEEALAGVGAAGPAGADGVARAAQSAAEGTRPAAEPAVSAAYRAHLARTLTRRAVLAAARMG